MRGAQRHKNNKSAVLKMKFENESALFTCLLEKKKTDGAERAEYRDPSKSNKQQEKGKKSAA